MYPNGITLYRYLRSGYDYVQRGIALVGWVLLGLGLIALLVQVLSNFPNWLGPIFFGPTTKIVITEKMDTLMPGKLSSVFISQNPIFSMLAPAPEALLLYIMLTVLQSRLFLQPRRRMLSLLALILALPLMGIPLILAIITSHVSLPAYLPDPFQLCIIMYAITAYARVNFSRKESWLIEGIVLCIALLCTATNSYLSGIGHAYLFGAAKNADYFSLPPDPASQALHISQITVPDFSQWSLQIPMLGIQVGGVSWLFQFVIWLLGLFCLHIFIGIGVHERAARRRSDELVKELTMTQEQLRAYALRAEELATMRERERVAREVHDTLAQGLTAIKMHLEAGAMVFRLQPELAQKHIERASELAGEHLSETRNSILNLRADALDGRTLPLALAKLAPSWRPDSGLVASTSATGGTGGATFGISGIAENDPFWLSIPPAVELACYRIAQEALSNAAKHGQAQRVEIELSLERQELCLTITDDGSGFDPSAISGDAERAGFGIIGMHERLKLLNGRLEIISAAGAGTQVVAMIPLESVKSMAHAKLVAGK